MAEWNLLPHEEAKLLNVARDEALIAHADHAYLPNTPALAALFEPHEWVREAMRRAYSLGRQVQDGVVGFGDSPDAAMWAFDEAWREKLPPTPDTQPTPVLKPENVSFIDTSQLEGVVSTEIVHSYPPAVRLAPRNRRSSCCRAHRRGER